jgi:P27 family predicted phage terminase small subunit
MWMSEEAAAEWEEIVQVMSGVPGWLTAVNKTTLAGHCHWYAVWKEAESVLAKEGRVYEVVIGADPATGEIGISKKIHPMVKIAKEAWECMLKADKELGITPARGSSVRVPTGDDSDENGLDRTG